MNENLNVSIIVPCYNQAQYLDEALQSILDQTYLNWECVIVNDGSTDNTEAIARKWIEKDERFNYVFQKNGGLSSARNAGLKIARGEYIQFLDSDDLIQPSKLGLSIDIIEKEYSNLVISNFRMFTENPNDNSAPFCNLTKESFNYKNILLKWDKEFSIPIHCGLFSFRLLKDFHFPVDLKAKEDWLLWLWVFKENPTVIFINKPLSLYRQHNNNMTKNLVHMREYERKVLKYLPNIISPEEYITFLLMENELKNKRIEGLEKNICNYKKTRTYRISNYMKRILKIG